ncbi:hypothetical protein RchiOBHm_Chr2g0147701 [Rosa chinensis]|uniref:Uncharacterized protein n=1 Tax=Rosa chinensis TaxID=74649 RepID=A0A2P6RZ89_ROSCH|nr:hypothetical protein RchiOBHm_Chr2g0147701 [Rosa chinensis]
MKFKAKLVTSYCHNFMASLATLMKPWCRDGGLDTGNMCASSLCKLTCEEWGMKKGRRGEKGEKSQIRPKGLGC